MRERFIVAVAILALGAGGITGCKKKEQPAEAPAPAATAPAPAPAATTPAAPAGAKSGDQLFKQYCAACHPDGGNTMNAKKTLHHADMAANNVNSADDIVKLMRNPGAGMTKFDEATIPDPDAKAIAQYILDTYK